MQKDAERTAFFEEHGLKVMRFTNIEVNRNFEGVCVYIDMAVKEILK